MTASDPWRVLTDHQAAVARRFLAARAAEHTHLVIYLSGAHAYGFPSPDQVTAWRARLSAAIAAVHDSAQPVR